MKSTVNVSTICYSPKEYVKVKLDTLIQCGKIDYYIFIEHKAEEDEKKNHIHLLVCPASSIDTKDLDNLLSLPKENEEVLGTCKIWQKTGKHISDWILYALHEELYLRIKKCETKKYHYKREDFISSDSDTTDVLVYEAYHETEFSFNNKVLQLLANTPDLGKTSREIVLNGFIPLNQMCSYHYLLKIIGENK